MAKKKKKKKREAAEEKKSAYLGSVRFFKHVILSVLGLAIIVPTVILIVVLSTKDRDDEDDRLIPRDMLEQNDIGGRGMVLTPDNFEEVLEEFRQPIEDASYIISMSLEWVFEKWDVPSRSTYVENYTDNKRTVYIDVFLDDENGDAMLDELIYSSPYIPVEAELKEFALQKEVPAGSYTATVVYYLVDDDFNVITDLSVGIRLIIKN
ncbi:MAG: hypothetical protein FWG70_00355 [Oscillospiraceae bacterium]|nr:hypothetical protein [Oscillospiraceae bacterium]